MPFTRRFAGAPFIALVLRPAPPRNFAEATPESGLRPSHLAHMDDMLGKNEEVRERRTEATKRGKIALLASELRSTARAKVTFSLPLWCREVLGNMLIPLQPPNDTSA